MVINARNMCEMQALSDFLHNVNISTNLSEKYWGHPCK